MKIHHIGYCVKNIDKAIMEFEKLGYKRLEEKFKDDDRKITIQFMKHHELLVELVAPTNEGESPVDGILNKMGNTPYHICYETDQLTEEISRLREDKYTLVSKPQQAGAISNCDVAFLYKTNVGLIELVEIKQRSF